VYVTSARTRKLEIAMAWGRIPVAAAMVRNTVDIARVVTRTKRKKIKN
jgi:hypothetical protein